MGTSTIQRHEQGHSRTPFQSEEEPRYAPQGEGLGLILEVHPGGPQWFSPMHSPTGKYHTQTFRPAVVPSTIEKIIIRQCCSCENKTTGERKPRQKQNDNDKESQEPRPHSR